MTAVILTALLFAVFTKAADKINLFHRNIWNTGLFFGILGIVFKLEVFYIRDVPTLIGIQDIPILLATLFFSPLAGFAAGAVFSVFYFFAIAAGIFEPYYGTVLSTLIVASYAAVMKQWVIDMEKPTLIPAMMSAFFGEIIHLSLVFVIGSWIGVEARILEMLSYSYPSVPACAALAAGFASVLCVPWKKWKSGFSSSLTISLLILGVAFVIVETTTMNSASRRTKSTILTTTEGLHTQIDDQIDYSLHSCAEYLTRQINKPKKYDRAFLQRLADDQGLDEINVYDKEGKLVAGNDPVILQKNQRLPKKYAELIAGKTNFYTQDFEPGISNPTKRIKYIALPLPNRDGFLQLGYCINRLEQEFSEYFFPMFEKTTIGENGFFVVTDSAGLIVAPVAKHKDVVGKKIKDFGMTEAKLKIPPHRFFEVYLFGIYGQCYLSMDFGKWHIYAFLPYTEFYGDAVTQTCIYSLVLFLICIGFRLAMLNIAKKQKKIDDLQAADMELAGTIQTCELPEKTFENSCCRVQANMVPAKKVGGDFYDYYELSDGRIAVTIADVSGKGIPAAFFMMKAKNILKNSVCHIPDLALSVTKANEGLNKNNDMAMFITAWIGIFNPADKTLKYVSAGHNPPVILRHDGSLEWLNKGKRQKPLAAFSQVTYQEEKVILASGDRLFLYTDGVTEATNLEEELYGNERLEKSLCSNDGSIIDSVMNSLNDFTAAAPVADDITILTLEIKK